MSAFSTKAAMSNQKAIEWIRSHGLRKTDLRRRTRNREQSVAAQEDALGANPITSYG
jgi:hypothetical protein